MTSGDHSPGGPWVDAVHDWVQRCSGRAYVMLEEVVTEAWSTVWCTTGAEERATASRATLADVLSDWLAPLKVPILGGLPIGHGRDPASVPLGTTATIDATAGTLTVSPGVH